jgi:GH18 family chitinase
MFEVLVLLAFSLLLFVFILLLFSKSIKFFSQIFSQLQFTISHRYEQFNGLKNKSRGLKTMLAIGGWNAGSKAFSEMVETPERRLKFTLSAMEFLRQYNFDGLDIDWEYPTLRQGKMEDKPRFAMLIKVNIFIMMNSNYLLL